MITKEYIKQVNPKSKPYNPKYSEGTHKWLNKYKNREIRIFKLKSEDSKPLYSTNIYFTFISDGDILGTRWDTIMQNKYGLKDYTYWEERFEDITEWFAETYLRIGRCLVDSEHINFLLGENYNYVKEEERFEIIDGIKLCKWCGKEIN